MDRELSPKVIRNQQIKRYIWILGVVILLFSAFFLFRSALKPTITRSTLRTSIVDTGSIEATISARGVVVPQLEVVINSSIDSKIIDVYHRSGDIVNKGDAILLLDKEEILNAHEKMLEEKLLNNNESKRKQLEFIRALDDLETSKSIKELSLKNLESDLKETKILEEMGGGTMEAVEQADFKLKVAQTEFKQLVKKIEHQKSSITIEEENRKIEESIEGRKLRELEKQITLADVKAEFDGVVTWVNEEIGKRVIRQEAIVRLADLNSYKVNCNISDIHADKIKVGERVIIGVNEQKLAGTISQVSAGLSNGEVSFNVRLTDDKNSLLRPNLEVDVFVITSYKEQVARVQNGGFYNGSKDISVFIIREDEAVRVEIKTGASNFEYVEIISGLSYGEEVIISDLTNELRHDRLRIIE